MQTTVSPFELLPFLDSKKFLEGNLTFNDVKRRVLAEFDLNDNQPLEVSGKSIGKSEALRIIEVFKHPEQLREVLELEDNPDLKSFIAGDSIKYILLKSNYDKALPESMQSQFQERFNYVVSKEYVKGEYELLSQVFLFPIAERVTVPVDQDAYEVLFRKVKSDLVELEEIYNLSSPNERFTKAKAIVRSYSKEKALLVNVLPDSYNSLKYSLAVISINLSTDIYNELRKKNVPKILARFVMYLDTDEELVKLARENWKVFNDQSSGVSSGGSSSGGGFSFRSAIWIVLVIVKVIFLISKCA